MSKDFTGKGAQSYRTKYENIELEVMNDLFEEQKRELIPIEVPMQEDVYDRLEVVDRVEDVVYEVIEEDWMVEVVIWLKGFGWWMVTGFFVTVVPGLLKGIWFIVKMIGIGVLLICQSIYKSLTSKEKKMTKDLSLMNDNDRYGGFGVCQNGGVNIVNNGDNVKINVIYKN